MSIIDITKKFQESPANQSESTQELQNVHNGDSNEPDYKVARLANYLYLKKYKHKKSADNSSMQLRRGIVVKMHQLRKEQSEYITKLARYSEKELELITGELLDITSKFVEYILNINNISTLEILNKYGEFKILIERKVKILSS